MSNCKDCNVEIDCEANMVMLHDYIWEDICDHTKDIICDRCLENRLGRTIQSEDLMESDWVIVPCNQMWINSRKPWGDFMVTDETEVFQVINRCRKQVKS